MINNIHLLSVNTLWHKRDNRRDNHHQAVNNSKCTVLILGESPKLNTLEDQEPKVTNQILNVMNLLKYVGQFLNVNDQIYKKQLSILDIQCCFSHPTMDI